MLGSGETFEDVTCFLRQVSCVRESGGVSGETQTSLGNTFLYKMLEHTGNKEFVPKFDTCLQQANEILKTMCSHRSLGPGKEHTARVYFRAICCH